MRLLTLLLTASLAAAESHPTWWTYASPEATALVGIRWENVRSSVFADAVASELVEGEIGLPDLACLKQAREIVIASPALLVMESGTFATAILRKEAAAKGMKAVPYRGVNIWVSSKTLGIAQISEQLVLAGTLETLETAIDRSLAEYSRRYSPLLLRAARYAGQDLWVVASALPDPVANRFVPIDATADGFEGLVSFASGLHLDAVLTAASEENRGADRSEDR